MGKDKIMKKEAPAHPKMLDLAKRLELPRVCCVGLLERLFHFASAYARNGDLTTGLSWEGVCDSIGWIELVNWTKQERDNETLKKALLESSWLEQLNDGRLYIAGWHRHCEDRVDKYLARAGETYANGAMPRRTPPNIKEKTPCPDKSGQVRKCPEKSAYLNHTLTIPLPSVSGQVRTSPDTSGHGVGEEQGEFGAGTWEERETLRTEIKGRLEALFNRPPSHHWSRLELEELIREVAPREDVLNELALVEEYYRAMAKGPRDQDRRRQSLAMLLQEWTGEVDRARNWRPKTETKTAGRLQYRGLQAEAVPV